MINQFGGAATSLQLRAASPTYVPPANTDY